MNAAVPGKIGGRCNCGVGRSRNHRKVTKVLVQKSPIVGRRGACVCAGCDLLAEREPARVTGGAPGSAGWEELVERNASVALKMDRSCMR